MELLLVEDNPGDVRITQEALRQDHFAHHLHVVRDGVEALEFLRGKGKYADAPRPHIILLDLNLPRMNGKELLAQIKSDPSLRRIPVMVLTTSNAEQDLMKAYDLHANCYITKPENLEQFLRVIRCIESFWFHVASLPSA